MTCKKIHYSLFLASLILLMSSEMSNAKSIGDTIKQAVISNPDIHAAYVAEQGQVNVVKEKRSGFFPIFSAEASFEAMRVKDINTKSAVGSKSENGYGGEGRLRMSQTIYDASNTLNSYRAAKTRLNASKYETANKSTDVALSSVLAHLNVLRLRELEYITEAYLKDLSSYVSRIKDNVDGGGSDVAELLQAKTITTIAKNNLLNYQEQKQFSEADYLQVVGELPVNELTISDSDISSRSYIPSSIDEALNIVRNKHPMLKSAQFTLDALGYDIKAEQATKKPRIDAELSHFMREQKEEFGGELEDSSALVRMTWNLETGGALKARIAQRKKSKEEAYLRIKSIERELEKELRQNMTRYHTSLKRLKLQDTRRKDNAGIFANYKDQFEGGKRKLLDIVNARNQLYQANIEYTNSYYGYYLAQFESLNALGVLQDAFKFSTFPVASK